jgi:lysyl-tRNA synthetase class II
MPAIFDYFTQLGLFANTSVVQFPAAINVKVLPKGLKVEITDQWEEYKSNLEVTSPYFEEKYCRMQERRIKSSGDKIINYMNSENRYEQDWQATLKYIHTLDSVHGTDFISTYPEFDTYWGTNAL